MLPRRLTTITAMLCLAATGLTTGLTAAEGWSLNSFPGPGHKAIPGPWGPGQGAGRCEKINAFGVHPLNGDFMLLLTDLGPVSQSRDGVSFHSAPIPVSGGDAANGGSAVAFNAHDADVAYALVGGRLDNNREGLSGWWRTGDGGETWNIWWSDIDTDGGTSEHYGRQHGNQTLLSDPLNDDRLFFASFERGLMVLDDASDDPRTNGSVLAFADQRIKTLATAVRDGTTLVYAIVGTGGSSADKDHGGELWRLNIAPNGAVIDQAKLADGESWTDVTLDPSNDGSGFAIDNFQTVLRFSDWGDDWTATTVDVTPANELPYPNGALLFTVQVNPADSQHVVITADNRFAWPNAMDRLLLYSTDGGDTWQGITRPVQTIGGDDFVPSVHFYGASNFRNGHGDYAFRVHKPGGAGDLVSYAQLSFIPGDPRGLRLWGGNWEQRSPLESTDGGATLRPFGYGGQFKKMSQIDVVVDADGTRHMASAHMEHGLKVSHDGGLSWHAYTDRNTTLFGDLWQDSNAETPSKSASFFASSGWGIAFKPDPDDRGATIIGCYGMKLRDLDDDPNTIDARDHYVVRSTDGGETWEDTGERVRVRIVTNRRGPLVHWGRRDDGSSVVYVGNLRSRDDGATWESMDYDIASVSASDGDLILGHLYTDHSARTDHFYQLSTDGGDTWAALPQTPRPDLGVGGQAAMPVQPHKRPVAIDPNPLRNPRLDGGRQVRILLTGGEGVYVYDPSIDASAWSGPVTAGIHLRNGFTNETEQHRETDQIHFDPRPGHHDTVYIGNSLWQAAAHINNTEWLPPHQRPERRIFRSLDGGATWQALVDADDETVDQYMAAEGLEVDNTGRLFINDWAGVWSHPAFEAPIRRSITLRLTPASADREAILDSGVAAQPLDAPALFADLDPSTDHLIEFISTNNN